MSTNFTVPTALGDLEEEPYNLLPYPADFDEDADDGDRELAFDRMVSITSIIHLNSIYIKIRPHQSHIYNTIYIIHTIDI